MTTAERVQASIRAVNAAGREAIEAGDFVLYRHGSSDHPYLNYAVPGEEAARGAQVAALEAGAAPAPDAALEAAAPAPEAGRPDAVSPPGPAWRGLDALRAAFAAHDLRPRLEFVAECAPGLEDALLGAGFEIEDRLPVMTCTRDQARTVLPPDGVTLTPVAPDDAPAYRILGAEAFGSPPPTERELAAPPPAGGLLARLDGEPVGIGVHTTVAEGVSEVAGIGVREAFRRRGIAAAITYAAATAAFLEGAELCFLTPGDEGAERVYARAGFTRAGTTMVHMLG